MLKLIFGFRANFLREAMSVFAIFSPVSVRIVLKSDPGVLIMHLWSCLGPTKATNGYQDLDAN